MADDNIPTITMTLLPNGNVSVAMKGNFPPGRVFEAAALLTRFGNQMLDAAMLQQQEVMNMRNKLDLGGH